jgi:nitrite reductase/ring-hydroxylating ferredoxin subunit
MALALPAVVSTNMTESGSGAVQTTTKFKVARLADLEAKGCLVLPAGGRTVALFLHARTVYALDNRCPHMGFPLDRGTVCDGVLTCHWHHGRFDLATGGTFDQWADDAQTFPVEVVGGDIWVDVAPARQTHARQRERLRDGLEREIPLVIAKSVLSLLEGGGDPTDPFRMGLEFGVRHRNAGWGQGLTMHACFMNVLPCLETHDRSRALYHGLAAVARESHGAAPRFPIRPLPAAAPGLITLKRWFRQFVEVRDAEGAERCIASAVSAGASPAEMTDLLFAAVTDHRYIQTGHVADFANKAFEALDVAGWASAGPVLSSLAPAYASAERIEESKAWRTPVDLVAIVERAFEAVPSALEEGLRRRGGAGVRQDWRALVPILLGDNPEATVDVLAGALRDGIDQAELAGAVAYTAALRIAQFHTGNEFDDWVSAMHSFSFANAIHQATRRSSSPELMRGVFDGAMSIYLNRFLNVPPARLPERRERVGRPDKLLDDFVALLNNRQQVNRAGELVFDYLSAGGPPDRLLAAMGHALAREDRDFHSIQMIEAAFRQYAFLRGTPEGSHVLVAAARYLAAHSPTVRSQGQTYQIASRLHRGERVFEESSEA